MISSLYRALHRLPYFRGRDRVGSWLQGFLRERIVSLDAGFRMALDLSEGTQRGIWIRGSLERATSALATRLLAPGDVAIDVGAHVGYYSLLFGERVGAAGRVIAIEPQPYNVERLLRNLVLNGRENVALFVSLAGEHERRQMLLHQTSRNTSDLSLVNAYSTHSGIAYSSSMVRLDSIFESMRLARIRLLKIDVEGYEHRVLEGLGSRIEAVDNIVLEVLGEAGTYDSNPALSMLGAAGFRLHQVDGSPWDLRSAPLEGNVWAAR